MRAYHVYERRYSLYFLGWWFDRQKCSFRSITVRDIKFGQANTLVYSHCALQFIKIEVKYENGTALSRWWPLFAIYGCGGCSLCVKNFDHFLFSIKIHITKNTARNIYGLVSRMLTFVAVEA